MQSRDDIWFAVQFEGVSLSCQKFDKIQTVEPGEIVENKRLGAALAMVKQHQDSYSVRLLVVPTAALRFLVIAKGREIKLPKIPRIPWPTITRSGWWQRLILFFVPFRARPSHFVGGGEHPLFGNTAGIPIWPAFAASSLFATSFRLSMATYMEHNE